ncbi:1-deoxy-D-xylulose-5-phosphate reductoisomerase [Alteromonas sp. a30]|uniref:1-deoxy-D-xylulose-5-phosphate reductoisomerase n=1 Tax=Alteromonas sp. a30 TaxID=2730917 RepID=UPI002282EA78|nr:1-deoxy-D-xylulose-5-phosphate reductoisomerase [Alteromonas sp. a30]MCY7294319.1 1-deoxy-D-xylulose-5-phosphate reductoisomerase [Alteromonas sp. a30]
MQNICVLGSTGSIGISTLDVVKHHPDKYRVFALSCFSQIDMVVEQAKAVHPQYIVCADEAQYQTLKSKLNDAGVVTEILVGEEGLITIATLPEVDMVMAAIVGAAGLAPTYAAAKAGKRILLANKESLVMSGSLFMQSVKENNALLLPVDSEHNAIFQCLPQAIHSNEQATQLGIKKLLLTGSGGPFLNTPLAELETVTPEQACNHPNWDMGRKISVDSATMMNKGLEFIEAHWLFHMPKDMIQIVVHPQSVIHSMVQYQDGSVLAQMGRSDMRIPIAHVMAYPERIDSGVEALDFMQLNELTFCPPDFQRFPNLELAINAVDAGQWASTALNAANEISVAAFLNRQIRFTDIARINAKVVERINACDLNSIESVITHDIESRHIANQILRELT